MSDSTPDLPIPPTASMERVFPTLTSEQMDRVALHGRVRQVRRGEVIVEVGDVNARFFVVAAGRLEAHRPSGMGGELVAVHTRGQFTGEATMLSGRRGLVRVRASEPSEVLELQHEHLLTLVQTDRELSDIFMRAFILRRMEVITHGLGDVVIVGSRHSPGTLRIKEFLTRNGHPHAYIDLDHDAGVQDLLDRFHVSVADVPILICRGEMVLRNPTNQRIAECLGFNEAIDHSQVRDLVVIGAGPCGLAAAVYKHVFVMTGAVPSTEWLRGCLVLDAKGFIKTGPDLTREELAEAHWPLTRQPFLLETSRPGVFAVGDVRAGNIKRVASAVGEGSIAVALVHQVLH